MQENDLLYDMGTLEVQYDSLELIKPLHLTLPQKGLALITGQNGVGKSSFLLKTSQLFIQLKILRRSEIHYLAPLHSFEKSLPLWGQDVFHLYSKKPWPDDLPNILVPLKDRRMDQMSSGEFQALLLIAHLSTNDKVLLLDEPFSHLSENLATYFLKIFKEQAEKKLIIFVSHHPLVNLGHETLHLQIQNQTLEKKVCISCHSPQAL